ncbi:MbeD/MobD family mobilization/exclusion protein [Klebsiella michiganensis]|nr:MbeD/MobD family mobilization/exclusion protein [Klebsiella michiganensis]
MTEVAEQWLSARGQLQQYYSKRLEEWVNALAE